MSASIYWDDGTQIQLRVYTVHNGQLAERVFSGKTGWEFGGKGQTIGYGVAANSPLSAIYWNDKNLGVQIRVYYTTSGGNIAERAFTGQGWEDGGLPQQPA